MPTLLDALSDGSYDLQNKRDLSGDFSKKLLRYRDEIVSDYLKYKTDLSKEIAKVAKRDSLNEDHIQRIIEEVNNQVYLIEYDKTKGSTERDVEFNIASSQKVKQYMKGEFPVGEKQDDNKSITKSAFETTKIDGIEKIASESSKYDIFNGNMQYSYGDLSTPSRVSEDRFLIKKIASKLNEDEQAMEKTAKEIQFASSEMADAFIKLEMLGANTSDIASSIYKSAGLNQEEFKMIKEATESRTQMYKERKSVPDNFSVDFSSVNLEKSASEIFSLGKYSLTKVAHVCDSQFPKIAIMSNKVIASVSDLVKIASSMKSNIESLKDKNQKYIATREKCASAGITPDMLDDSFFAQSQM